MGSIPVLLGAEGFYLECPICGKRHDFTYLDDFGLEEFPGDGRFYLDSEPDDTYTLIGDLFWPWFVCREPRCSVTGRMKLQQPRGED